MKLRLDCIPCLVRQTLKAARLAIDEEEVQERILREALKRLENLEWKGSPAKIARKLNVEEIIEMLTGVNDPYKELKRKSNDEALSLMGYVKELIAKSEDPLFTALKLSIAGNVIDFAALDKFDLRETIEKVLKQELAINYYDEFKKDLMKANTLLFFDDNAGEIVFDKIFIEEMIKARDRPFNKITFVVKGGPRVNDATIEDAYYVGIDKLPNVVIKTVSSGRAETGPEMDSPEVLSWIESHDLVISKGQGNFEDLNEVGGIYFALMVKCPVVAKDLGVKVGDVILWRS